MQGEKYKLIYPLLVKQRYGLLQLLFLAMVAATTTAFAPWPMKLLVDYALTDDQSTATYGLSATAMVVLAACASIGLFVLTSGIGVLSSWLWSKVGQRMVVDLSLKMFDRLQELSRRYHTRHPVADSLSRLTVDSWCIFTLAQALLITPVQNIITILVVGMFAWYLNPELAVMLFWIAPLLAISGWFFGEKIKQRQSEVRRTQAQVMAYVHQALSVIPLISLFNKQKHVTQGYRELGKTAINKSKRGTLTDQSLQGVSALIVALGAALVLLVGTRSVLAGTISIGDLLVFVGYLGILQAESLSLLTTYKDVKSADASLERVTEVFAEKDVILDEESARKLPRVTRRRSQDILFEDIYFEYAAGKPVLNGIDLHIKAGEKVAIVGSSGSGKSTLVSLLPRFYDPSGGRILVGGHAIHDLAVESLRDRISIVMQDPYLLPMSIAENISLGARGASREAIIEAATQANAAAFIRKLPEGYDTVLGERGVNLSGGQRQRLSIARALLKDAPILILDEPSSALDNNTESLLFDALETLMQGRTTIIIAHRLTTIRHVDRIVVLEQGQVAELGTHSELMQLNGRYAELYQAQMGVSVASVNPSRAA